MKNKRYKLPPKRAKGIGYCEHKGKVQYLTEADARKAMVLIWSRDPNVGMNDLHVYNNCPCCKFFHVGHVDERFKEIA